MSNEIKQKLIGYITAAFGLVASLAWNEAIKALIDTVFPFGQNSLLAKFIYAVLITIVAITIGFYLLKLARITEKQKS